MSWKRLLGMGLIFVGLFIILTGGGITGAAIGFGFKNYFSGFGILISLMGAIFLFAEGDSEGMIYPTVYHGTCRAFVELANERGGQFGPEYGVSFTPDYDHAKIFAEQWRTRAGRVALKEYFGKLPKEYAEPVVLEFDKWELGPLEEKLDGSAIEFFAEKGPVKLPKKYQKKVPKK